MKKNNKKIAAITFHSSHNHGSCLQAYALQTYVENSFDGVEYDIINLRTERQRKYYERPYDSLSIKNIVKRLIFLGYKSKIQMRSRNFEDFIAKYLNTTREYRSLDDLKKAKLNYDYYLSGSDQLWNKSLLDFDWSFFLEFAKEGKRVSYAASFGPKTEEWSNEDIGRAKRDLQKYDSISVREPGSAEMAKKITGKAPAINVDPTLLLDEDDWEKITSTPSISGDYIFMYDLKGLRKAYDIANYLSKRLNIPVVIVKENSKRHLFYHFKKAYESGPSEFLGYIKNAKIIVSSSFHGTVFSILFGKPFVAVDGKNDYRINNILSKIGLQERAVDSIDDVRAIRDVLTIDYSRRDRVLACEREKTKKYFGGIFGEK